MVPLAGESAGVGPWFVLVCGEEFSDAEALRICIAGRSGGRSDHVAGDALLGVEGRSKSLNQDYRLHFRLTSTSPGSHIAQIFQLLICIEFFRV